jgi:hypothetical protein
VCVRNKKGLPYFVEGFVHHVVRTMCLFVKDICWGGVYGPWESAYSFLIDILRQIRLL